MDKTMAELRRNLACRNAERLWGELHLMQPKKYWVDQTENTKTGLEDDEGFNKLLKKGIELEESSYQGILDQTKQSWWKQNTSFSKYTRQVKSQRWEEKPEGLKHAADRNDMKSFYQELREVFGPQKRETIQLNRETVLQDKNETRRRFIEHFN